MVDVDVVVIGGGQSGLATAHALTRVGLVPVVLEAGDRAVGSWPSYYDSLRLFSPARFSGLPGTRFPGDPQRYPRRDEVVDYLAAYAASLDVDIRTGQRVTTVEADGPGFVVRLDRGLLTARAVVAATGSFGNPYRPARPGLGRFSGTVIHAAEYRRPDPYAGQRIVVVGAGNSAVQIAAELAGPAHVTLATRAPIRFVAQRPLGRDVHFWLRVSGFDALPVGRWLRNRPTAPVLDHGLYRAGVTAGRPDRRPAFVDVEGNVVRWPDGTAEQVDTIVLATGYRPDLSYLRRLGALDDSGRPRQRLGLSTSHAGLGFVGLEWQHTPASATLRGVGHDAAYVARHLRRALRGRRHTATGAATASNADNAASLSRTGR